MSRLVRSRPKSHEMMHVAMEVPCCICDGGNRQDAERCRHCHAPLGLTYQIANERANKPQILAVLGPRGAGKTSYLGMLCDTLSRQRDACQAVWRGAFSVSLQQQVIACLADQRFPGCTPDEAERWNWNFVQLTDANGRRVRELIFPDMAGAVMERELDQQASPITRALLKKCAGAIVLLDTQRVERGDPAPEFFAMKVLSYLDEFGTRGSESWRRKPVAFLFTKSDCSQACMDSPRTFAESHVPGAFRQARSILKRFDYFAASVVGATVDLEIDGSRVSMPLRVEPRGIREPLTWMQRQLG